MFKDEGIPIKIPENGILPIKEKSEIDQALKEFEAQSNTQPQIKQPVEQVSKTSETPAMVQFLMKYSGGAIKDEKKANYVLVLFVVIAMGVSFYLFFGGGTPHPKGSSTMPAMMTPPTN